MSRCDANHKSDQVAVLGHVDHNYSSEQTTTRNPQYVSIHGVPSNRPELSSTSTTIVHNDVIRQEAWKKLKVLKNCREAIRTIEELEENLGEKNLLGPLLQVEKDILNWHRKECSTGSFFMTLFKVNGQFFSRIIETGCFRGFSNNEAINSAYPCFAGALRYHIFSEDDLQVTNTSSGNAEGRIKNQQYKRATNTINRDLGVLNQLNDGVETPIIGALLFLQHPKKSQNRFFVATPMLDAQRRQDLELAFIGYESPGRPRHLPGLQDFSLPLDFTLQHQLDALSVLDNSPNDIPKEIGEGDLKTTGRTHYYPASLFSCQRLSKEGSSPIFFRPRLCHFISSCKDIHACTLLKRKLIKSNFCVQDNPEAEQPSPADEMQPPTKRRRVGHRVSHLQQFNAVHPPVHNNGTLNMASVNLTIHEAYAKDMSLEGGNIIWMLHSRENNVFVLNDVCSEKGVLLERSFILCSVSGDFDCFTCSCDIFKLVATTTEDSSSSCVHCHFLEKEIVPLIQLINSSDFCPKPGIEEKFHRASKEKNNPCIKLPSGNVQKFCVKGSDTSVSFLHLSKDGQFVKCMSGECDIVCGSNKKKLTNLRDSSGLCPHLETFRANEEHWMEDGLRQEAETGEEENEEPDIAALRDELEQEPSQGDEDEKGVFDTSTGRWSFGGLSHFIPEDDKSELYRRHCRSRLALVDLDRDEEGYLCDRGEDGRPCGYVLKPHCPEQCSCGAGFANITNVDGTNLIKQHSTVLYCKYGAVKCVVASRTCRDSQCHLDYDGCQDGIFFWSKNVCIGSEIGYDFKFKFSNMKCSFSAFCEEKTYQYKEFSACAAPFVSVKTFLNWYFAWRAAFRLDFRQSRDPWCGCSPTMVVGDGTHVGLSLRRMSITPIENPQRDTVIETRHKRYDRVFLHKQKGVSGENLREARSHLKYICRKILGLEVSKDDSPDTSPAELQLRNDKLLRVCPGEQATEMVNAVVQRKFASQLLSAAADFLHVLAYDNPVSAAMPFGSLDSIKEAIQNLKGPQDGQALGEVLQSSLCAPELNRLLKEASKAEGREDQQIVYNFVLSLISWLHALHHNDAMASEPANIVGSYNPPSGEFYYFSESGEQVRQLPVYSINDDEVHAADEQCRKRYPNVASGGFGYMFFWMCPLHGHCYGGHLINGAEGRKDPFSSLFKYFPSAPTYIFYDNACQLNEYCLNREPEFFRGSKFFHDVFHSYNHKCAKTYRSRRVSHLKVNSEICEQFNAKLQSLKYVGSHMRQDRFMFMVQDIAHEWNLSKTETFNKKVAIARQSISIASRF